MKPVSIRLPLQALSINQAWQGRRFKTNIYKSYEREAFILLPKKQKIEGDVILRYEFGLKPRSYGISDVGNLEKCLTDILVKKGYIEDDRKVVEIHLKKVVSPEYYVSIEIEPYGTRNK